MTHGIIKGLKINHLGLYGVVASMEGNVSAYREPSMKY